MSSLKCLFTAAMLVACFIFFMVTSEANADWTSPVAVYDHSPEWGSSALIEFSIDGDQGTYAKLSWDGTVENGLPGYIVYDLGRLYEVSGFRFMPRIHDSADTGPEDISIFNYTDESLMPSGGPAGGYNPNNTTSLAADTNVNYLVSATLPPMHGQGDCADVMFSQTQARYIGIRCYTSYDGDWSNGGMNTFGEVYFDGIDITPPGDANFDGQVNGADAAILASNWLKKEAEGSTAFVCQTIASGISAGETYSVSFDAGSWINPSSMTADLYYNDNGTWKAVSSTPNVYTFEGSQELDNYTFDWTAEAGEDYIGKDIAIGFGIDGVDGNAPRGVDNVSVTKDSVELVSNGDFSGATLDPWNTYVSHENVLAFKDTWDLPSDPTLTMRIVGAAPTYAWGDGDFNGDGCVDDIDATILAANWTGSTASGSVPEPGCAVLFFSLITAVLCSHRLVSRK